MAHRFKRVELGKVSNESGEISLQKIIGLFTHREAPIGYVLEWFGKKIGFEADWYYLPPDGRGRAVLALRIEKFGSSKDVMNKLGLNPVRFASSKEQASALSDATEALLTLANAHWKGRLPEGDSVVDVGGQIFRMEDFGIILEDLGVDPPADISPAVRHRFRSVERSKVSTESGDVTLEWLRSVSTGPERSEGWLLNWQGKLIGFETPSLTATRDEGGFRIRVLKIERFGETGEVTKKLGLQPVSFESPGLRLQALLDAAEALLTLSNSHRKIHQPREGHCVVNIGARIFRMEDFGIVEDDIGID